MSKKVKKQKYQYCAFPMSTANLHNTSIRTVYFLTINGTKVKVIKYSSSWRNDTLHSNYLVS